MNSTQFTSWLEQRSQLSLSSYSDEKPLIMGIVNVTPDSFSDGGKFLSRDRACEQAFHLIAQGADLIDIGGQSTKPGALKVSTEVELDRVIPVIKQLRSHSDICISIDTNNPVVMEAAVNAGADMINDICALQIDGALAIAAKLGVPVCLMHMQGTPETMQDKPDYPDGVFNTVRQFFIERIRACEQAGIDKTKLILDPGFGFGKQVEDNLFLVKKLDEFSKLGAPVLLGVSRKSTIGAVLEKDVNDRLIGSIAVAVYAAMKGVGIIRVHDVEETHQALKIIERINRSNNKGGKDES